MQTKEKQSIVAPVSFASHPSFSTKLFSSLSLLQVRGERENDAARKNSSFSQTRQSRECSSGDSNPNSSGCVPDAPPVAPLEQPPHTSLPCDARTHTMTVYQTIPYVPSLNEWERALACVIPLSHRCTHSRSGAAAAAMMEICLTFCLGPKNTCHDHVNEHVSVHVGRAKNLGINHGAVNLPAKIFFFQMSF